MQEVDGSSPFVPTKIRGYSTVGSAIRSQRIGQGFESPYLHQKNGHFCPFFAVFKPFFRGFRKIAPNCPQFSFNKKSVKSSLKARQPAGFCFTIFPDMRKNSRSEQRFFHEPTGAFVVEFAALPGNVNDVTDSRTAADMPGRGLPHVRNLRNIKSAPVLPLYRERRHTPVLVHAQDYGDIHFNKLRHRRIMPV